MKILRGVLFVTGLIGFAWFCIPLTSRILNIGNLIGILINVLLMIYAIFAGNINGFIKDIWKTAKGKVFLGLTGLMMLISAVLIIIISVCMFRASHNRPTGDVTLVVLGCHVRNGRPSLMLGKRLRTAQKYLEENEDTICILSGGQGSDEEISEAQCMYDYLTGNGISPDRLIMENRSTSTIENLQYSFEIIQDQGLNTRTAIVTNEFHEYRASLIAKKLGIESYAVSAWTHWWFYPTYLVREWFGVVYEWCR